MLFLMLKYLKMSIDVMVYGLRQKELRVLLSQKFNLYSAIVTEMKSTELSLVKVKLKTTRRLITNL